MTSSEIVDLQEATNVAREAAAALRDVMREIRLASHDDREYRTNWQRGHNHALAGKGSRESIPAYLTGYARGLAKLAERQAEESSDA